MQIGTVTAMDENSITLKLSDGNSKIIALSDSTAYTKSTDGTKSDVRVGDTIAVVGSATDKTITATSIQLNPVQGRMGMPQSMPKE